MDKGLQRGVRFAVTNALPNAGFRWRDRSMSSEVRSRQPSRRFFQTTADTSALHAGCGMREGSSHSHTCRTPNGQPQEESNRLRRKGLALLAIQEQMETLAVDQLFCPVFCCQSHFHCVSRMFVRAESITDGGGATSPKALRTASSEASWSAKLRYVARRAVMGERRAHQRWILTIEPRLIDFSLAISCETLAGISGTTSGTASLMFFKASQQRGHY